MEPLDWGRVALATLVLAAGTGSGPVRAASIEGLDALARESTMQLSTVGRKTGKPHTVGVWFVVDGDVILLSTLNVKRDWVRNAQKTPAVTFTIGGRRLRGNLTTVTDADGQRRARELLRQKYLTARIGSWFGFGPEGTFRIDALAEEGK